MNCKMLHKLAHNATYLEKATGEVRCSACNLYNRFGTAEKENK